MLRADGYTNACLWPMETLRPIMSVNNMPEAMCGYLKVVE
jgi:hypothetical protein